MSGPGPQDPFTAVAVPDLHHAAAAAYALFTAYVAAGFTEAQALHLTTAWTPAIFAATAAAAPPAADPGTPAT